jgi:hypothetical protein
LKIYDYSTLRFGATETRKEQAGRSG